MYADTAVSSFLFGYLEPKRMGVLPGSTGVAAEVEFRPIDKTDLLAAAQKHFSIQITGDETEAVLTVADALALIERKRAGVRS